MSSFKVMPKHLLRTWIDRLRPRYRVIGPKALHGQYVFDVIDGIEELMLEYPATVLPPKKYLLPQREELFSFNTRTMEMKAVIEAEPTVIFGIHTCDMHAITLLDKIHSTGYTDQHYKARRDQIVLVSIECLKPCSANAFCKSMGTASAPEQFDVHLIDMGDRYGIEIGSDRGAALFEGCSSVWEPTEADEDRADEVLREKWDQFDYKLSFDVSELPDLLAQSQKSPVWDEIGERCLACGMCTNVCPTCYCFDVQDEIDLNLENGKRVRVWDSCLLEKFAVVAGGHNFRTALGRRLRHRFFRKGKYQYEAYGVMGCVGCGRCSTACLVNITPVETFNKLYHNLQTENGVSGQEAKV